MERFKTDYIPTIIAADTSTGDPIWVGLLRLGVPDLNGHAVVCREDSKRPLIVDPEIIANGGVVGSVRFFNSRELECLLDNPWKNLSS